MNKLSVAIATFNEEKNIADCLKSISQLADEIIIVDGTSQDKTVEIAKKYTGKILVTENKPMFHTNKNMAIDDCTSPWVLLLDADERVTKELADEMKKIAKEGSHFSAFWIRRKNYFLGKWLKKGGAYPDPVIRFFKKGKGRLPEVSVHEQLKVQGEVGWLKNDLMHLADPSFSRYLLRSNRYTTLEAENIFQKNPGTGIFSIINYLFIKPFIRFFLIYIRHLGVLDGFAGLVWALYSALHIVTSYVKYWEAKNAGSDQFDSSSNWA